MNADEAREQGFTIDELHQPGSGQALKDAIAAAVRDGKAFSLERELVEGPPVFDADGNGWRTFRPADGNPIHVVGLDLGTEGETTR